MTHGIYNVVMISATQNLGKHVHLPVMGQVLGRHYRDSEGAMARILAGHESGMEDLQRLQDRLIEDVRGIAGIRMKLSCSIKGRAEIVVTSEKLALRRLAGSPDVHISLVPEEASRRG